LTLGMGTIRVAVGQVPRRTTRGGGRGGSSVIILGVVLLVIGLVTGITILWIIGLILLIIGVFLLVQGSMGRPVRGRRHYF
jgi:uncharacterized membrane protein HdeD (DUF308 family)